MTVVDHPTRRSPSGSDPEGRELQPAEIDEIRRRLQQHKLDTGYSDAKVEEKSGIPRSTLNLFANNKYPGDDESGVAARVAVYLELHDHRAAIGGAPEYVRTSVAQKLERVILTAEALQMFGIIATGSGTGKSRVIAEARMSRRNSLFISASEDLDTRWSLLNELVYALTKDGRRRTSPAHARREVVNTLRGKNRTVFVDEAQFLSAERLDMLRCVLDQTGCPIILSGNESIFERGPGRIGGSSAHTQFTSRVAARVHIAAEDVTKSDVRLIAQQLVGKPVVDQTIDRLLAIARAGGAFRTVEKVLKIAKLNANGAALTADHVFNAIDYFADVTRRVHSRTAQGGGE
ncbi:MAG TPA: AAA family ATPase [Thermoanaerobaculia bacterium]|nr:AAA family ATPase [Thermoanaerobaculia bacterium]